MVRAGDSEQTVKRSVRESTINYMALTKETDWIYQRIHCAVIEVNTENWNFDLTETEPLQFGRYGVGHFFDWHVDSVAHDSTMLRKLSISVQLSQSEDYEGGELQFKVGSDEIVATQDPGSVIIFPSYIRHRVTPVTSGVRYSLVQWVSSDAPQPVT